MFGVGRLLHEPEEEDDNIADEEDDDEEVDVDIKQETDVTRSNTKTQFANFSGLIQVTICRLLAKLF